MGSAIYDLTDGGSPQATDYIPVIRSPYGPGDDRKVKISNFGPKYNLAAVTAPTATNDSSSGQDYSIGSLWFDTVTLVLYRCIDATANAAKWQSFGDGPYKAGKWFTPIRTTQANSTSIAAGTIYLHPFKVRAKVVVTAIGFRMQTGGASQEAKFGVWANNPTTDQPTGSPLVAVNTGQSCAGATMIQSSASVTLYPDQLYWFGTKFTNTAGTHIAIAQTEHSISELLGQTADPATTAFLGFSAAEAYSNNLGDLTSASFTAVTTSIIPLGRIKT